MDAIANFLRIAFVMALSSAFVYICIVLVRRILHKLLSPKLIRIYEALKPLFVPSCNYDPTHLEISFWLIMSNTVFTILTVALAVFFGDLLALLWDLLQAI